METLKKFWSKGYVKIIIICVIIFICFSSGFFGGYTCGSDDYYGDLERVQGNLSDERKESTALRQYIDQTDKLFGEIKEAEQDLGRLQQWIIEYQSEIDAINNQLEDDVRGIGDLIKGERTADSRLRELSEELEKRFPK